MNYYIPALEWGNALATAKFEDWPILVASSNLIFFRSLLVLGLNRRILLIVALIDTRVLLNFCFHRRCAIFLAQFWLKTHRWLGPPTISGLGLLYVMKVGGSSVCFGAISQRGRET